MATEPTPPSLQTVANQDGRAAPGLWAGLGFAMLGSILFSGKAIIIKLAYRYEVDAMTLLMLRMAMALPFFVLIAWWTGRPRKGVAATTVRPRDAAGILALGFSGYYLASYLDFAGLAYISASLERLILYLNPTLVLILGALFFHRPVHRNQVLGAAISYLGVVVVFGHEISFVGSSVLWGSFLVFLSAVSYAVYLTYSGELVQRFGSMRLVGLATTVACVLCVGQFLLFKPLDGLWHLAPQVWWLSLLNALLCTVAPVLLVMMAIERVGPSLSSQVGMVGPVFTIAMGAALLGEVFNAWVLAGTVLVLAGVYVCTRQPQHSRRGPVQK